MRFVLPVFAKINITLRIVGRRMDGYHNIVSAFMRIPSGESLSVSVSDSDRVEMRGLDVPIEGENIVARALRRARAEGVRIPPMDIEICKAVYAGSGLGSASGNAAALLQFFASEHPLNPWMDIARGTGADVPFLFSGLPAAVATGTGEHLEPIEVPYMRGIAVIPDWTISTAEAYREIDEMYGSQPPVSEDDARGEILCIMDNLKAGEHVGLLPNDFTPVLINKHPQYEELFSIFEEAGCLAWGITGSGSAAFALIRGEAKVTRRMPSWIKQALYISPVP